MNEEISHVAQWHELSSRAKNFGLQITLDAVHEVFILSKPGEEDPTIGEYHSLFELRAGISNWVAMQRAGGAKF